MKPIPIPCEPFTDYQIGLLCHNYAVKGVQMYFAMTALDISVLASLYGQGTLLAGAVSRIVMRARSATYPILERCTQKGIIEQVGKQKRYRLTDKGNAIYAKYLEGYEVMKNNLIELERLRLRRMAG